MVSFISTVDPVKCVKLIWLLSIKIFIVKDVSRSVPLIVDNIENSAVVISWPAEGYINAANTALFYVKELVEDISPYSIDASQLPHPATDPLPKSPRHKPSIALLPALWGILPTMTQWVYTFTEFFIYGSSYFSHVIQHSDN